MQDVTQVKTALNQQNYIATDEIATVMYLADQLGKPLLAEGPAGVGKTELAKAWSKATGKPPHSPAMLRGTRREQSAL